MHYFIKFEFPGFSLIIDMTATWIFWNMHSNGLKQNNIQNFEQSTRLFGDFILFFVFAYKQVNVKKVVLEFAIRRFSGFI